MALPNGSRDLSIDVVGRFDRWIDERPQLDFPDSAREPLDQFEGLIQVAGLDDRETCQELFGLGEGAVRHRYVAVLIVYRLGRPNRLKSPGKDEMSGFLNLRLPEGGGTASFRNAGQLRLRRLDL